MGMQFRIGLVTACAVLAIASPAGAQDRPWLNPSLSPDERATLAVQQMTLDEKLLFTFGYFGSDWQGAKPPTAARYGSAGYVPGVPRLGIPAQWQTDAGVGVATQGGASVKRERTSLPSGILTAATWNPDLAFNGGRIDIGRRRIDDVGNAGRPRYIRFARMFDHAQSWCNPRAEGQLN